MFKYISEILGKFTESQRIAALLIVLFSTILIALGPSLIKNNDCADVYLELEKQREDILKLNRELVDVQINANNERIAREKEIAKIVQMIKTDTDNCPLCDHTHLTPYEKDLVKEAE
jgi:hypothetical protein